MKRFNVKLIIIAILSICLLSVNVYSHSGRTDSNGGHRDTKNKSGLGSYHYHCGGHPAHLHPNGVCPYSSSYSKSGTSSSSSSSKAVETKPAIVQVSSIKINRIVDCIEEGETRFLKTTVTPEDATDKSIIWKSSDESIATVSSIGILTAIRPGVVSIIASTSNGKSDTIYITIKEKNKVENNNIYNSNNKQNDFENLGRNYSIGSVRRRRILYV